MVERVHTLVSLIPVRTAVPSWRPLFPKGSISKCNGGYGFNIWNLWRTHSSVRSKYIMCGRYGRSARIAGLKMGWSEKVSLKRWYLNKSLKLVSQPCGYAEGKNLPSRGNSKYKALRQEWAWCIWGTERKPILLEWSEQEKVEGMGLVTPCRLWLLFRVQHQWKVFSRGL